MVCGMKKRMIGKLFMTGVLCTCVGLSVSAQERLIDNTFVTLGIGTQLYGGDSDKHMAFGDRLTPAVDFSLGKWVTPGIGVALSYTGYKIKGLWSTHLITAHYATDIYYGPNDNGFQLYEQRAHFYNVHADVLFDIFTLLGRDAQRLYHLVPFVGVGWAHTYDHSNAHGNSMTLNAGLINSFRLSPRINLNVTLRGMLLGEGFDGEGGSHDKVNTELYQGGKGGGNVNADMMAGVTVGITYRFGRK